MAAGQGFKTFTTGEVLTASDVNGYLMQGINVFASSAARAAAITSPQEGQYSYLKDTNALEYYDGAAWVGAPVGDITSVTAGTGISGGGASGDVTITNSMATAITASGDLIQGTGTGTFARLASGTNGQYLTTNGSTLSWGTVSATPTTATATVATSQTSTSTSYTDLATAGPAVTVTTGTKALVIVTAFQQNNATATGNYYMSYAVSGSTTIAASDTVALMNSSDGNNGWGKIRASAASLVTLTAGSNTFTAKYRVTGSGAQWMDRAIFVMNLG